MVNNNWYLICNIKNNIAIDLIQLPDEWRGITGLRNLPNPILAAIGELSTEAKGLTIIPVADGELLGIDKNSIKEILSIRHSDVLFWVRGMRNLLINATDEITVSDRWNLFDVIGKKRITEYRQALRDITKQNLFQLTWPCIPPELDFIRNVSIDELILPCEKFMVSLKTPFPELTKEEIRKNQKLRIYDERTVREGAGVKIVIDEENHWFWTDLRSVARYAILEGLVKRKDLPMTYTFDYIKTMAGDFIPFTVELLFSIIDAGIENELKLFAAAEKHNLAVMNSNDPQNYDISLGWPETYTDSVGIDDLRGFLNDN